MPRKPAHLEMLGGKGPRQRVWEGIRRLARKSDNPFTEGDIWVATEGSEIDVEMDLIRDYRRGLVAAGILGTVTAGRHTGAAATYRLLVDEGAEAPRVRRDGSRVTMGLAQEQMWRTLRAIKGDISGRELAAYASTGAVPVSEKAARDYLGNLARAKYVEETVKGIGGGGGKGGYPSRFRLISNTGPRPPMVQRVDAIYDPNLGEVIWIKPINEETAIYGK